MAARLQPGSSELLHQVLLDLALRLDALVIREGIHLHAGALKCTCLAMPVAIFREGTEAGHGQGEHA